MTCLASRLLVRQILDRRSRLPHSRLLEPPQFLPLRSSHRPFAQRGPHPPLDLHRLAHPVLALAKPEYYLERPRTRRHVRDPHPVQDTHRLPPVAQGFTCLRREDAPGGAWLEFEGRDIVEELEKLRELAGREERAEGDVEGNVVGVDVVARHDFEDAVDAGPVAGFLADEHERVEGVGVRPDAEGEHEAEELEGALGLEALRHGGDRGGEGDNVGADVRNLDRVEDFQSPFPLLGLLTGADGSIVAESVGLDSHRLHGDKVLHRFLPLPSLLERRNQSAVRHRIGLQALLLDLVEDPHGALPLPALLTRRDA
mmetsp:Transcript_8224/g.20508  ORF Transcript_8224/g.20508 Transcript_8224/m.20508 type:complete len:313 (+) Transcript_8224:425-1363(+)